jgi:hypothetical protein
LAVPWHQELAHRSLYLPIAGVVVVVALLIAFFVGSGTRGQVKRVAAAAFWVLLPVAPIWAFFFVASDLQGARYLYLPAMGWAALLVALTADQPNSGVWRRVQVTLTASLIVTGAYGVARHLGPWAEAADLRDAVENAALAAGMNQCPAVALSNLPDSVKGAYVFRNGAPEAFAHDLHIAATLDSQAGACSFEWNVERRTFVRRLREGRSAIYNEK